MELGQIENIRSLHEEGIVSLKRLRDDRQLLFGAAGSLVNPYWERIWRSPPSFMANFGK